MSNLIDRDAAIDAISCDITIIGRQNAWIVTKTIETFINRIKALPSVEPEIIRCIDCKHWHNMHVCQHYSRFGIVETKRDDYCSKGEKRNDQTR